MRAAVWSLIAIAALWAVTRLAPHLSAGMAVLAVLVLAAPLTLLGAYVAAIRRAHWLHGFDRAGWVYGLLSGPVLRVALQLVAAILLSSLCLVRLVGQGWREWVAVSVAVLLVPAAVALWARAVEDQIAPQFRLAARLQAGRRGAAALALVVYGLLIWTVPADVTGFDPATVFQSALVEQAVLISDQWRFLEQFALGELSALGEWARGAAVLVTVLGALALVWTASGLAAALMLPRKAGPVALAPVGVPAPTKSGLAWSAAVVTVLVGFVLVPLMAMGELTLRALPPDDRPSQIFVTRVEEIGGQYFEPGTISALNGRRLALQAQLAPEARAELARAVDAGFDRMQQNVEPFLDWYYSLPAEYARIGHLLGGDIEVFLARRIEEELTKGAPFEDLYTVIDRIAAENASALGGLEQDLARLAQARAVSLDANQPVAVIGRSGRDGLLTFDGVDLTASVTEGLRTRLIASGGAGLAGVMTTAVMTKVGAKGATKLAAKALTKVAAAKTTGGAAGAGVGSVIGGVVGSVVPGLGTALGAALGGVLGGAALGVATDKLLLELEEALNRDDLAAVLYDALNEARADAMATILKNPPEK